MESYISESLLNKTIKGDEKENEAEETVSLEDFKKFSNVELRKLIYLFRESSVGRLKVDNGEVKVGIVRLKKKEVKPLPLASMEQHQMEQFHNLKPVISRYLGVLRLMDKKGQPFVQAGDYVKKGQSLGYIETLNIINEIKADRSGVVVEIFEEEGHPVEYGQVLFLVDSTIG